MGFLPSRTVTTLPKIKTRWQRSVVVGNKPAADGILGADNVAHSPRDGYRLLMTYAVGPVVNPSFHKKIPYDVTKDFERIAQIDRGGNLLLVRPSLPGSVCSRSEFRT